jgi:hypothetical protein
MTRQARWLAEWRKSAGKPVLYHGLSRVVDRRFVLGTEEKEKFRTLMRMQEKNPSPVASAVTGSGGMEPSHLPEALLRTSTSDAACPGSAAATMISRSVAMILSGQSAPGTRKLRNLCAGGPSR